MSAIDGGEQCLCGANAVVLLQSATDAMGTVYFEDDYTDARDATRDTLAHFEDLLNSLSPDDRSRMLAAHKPRMAQLEQELRTLTDMLIHDDH